MQIPKMDMIKLDFIDFIAVGEKKISVSLIILGD